MDENVGKVLVVVATLGVLAGIFLVVMGARQEFPVGSRADVDTIGLDDCGGGTAHGIQGYGIYQDLAGDARTRGEVYDRTRAWYSWFVDGQSFPIVGEAKVVRCPGIQVTDWPYVVEYTFTIDNGAGFRPFYQDRVPNGVVHYDITPGSFGTEVVFPAFSFQIDGFGYCTVPSGNGCPSGKNETFIDGAVLQVVVRVGRPDRPFPFAWPLEDIARDQLELRNALPHVEWSKPGYTVGETATANWVVPATKDDRGNPAYFLSIVNLNTNTAVSGWDQAPLGETRGQAQVLVTTSMLSNVLATCQNRLRAEVYTQLVLADRADASIRDEAFLGAPAPTVTSIALDRPEYFEGDTVKVSWSTSGNVSRVHVSWTIGGLGADIDLAAATRSYSFRAPSSGILKVEVTAYNLCTPSDVKTVIATVGNAYPRICEVYPGAAQCSAQDLVAVIVGILAIVAVVLAFLGAVWILAKVRAPPFLVLLLAIVAAGVVAILLALAGAFDGLAGVIG